MTNYNYLEITGYVLMAIGGVFWLSELFYEIESASDIYALMRIVLFLGVIVWSVGLMKKEKEASEL